MGSRSQSLVACSLAFGLLAGCAGHLGGLVPGSGASFVPAMTPQKVANCKGQKTAKKYASDVTTLSSAGGMLCVPTFGGFSGSIAYPGASPSVKMKLISSTTNYNNQLPPLGKGTPIFYLQLSISSGTTFSTNAPAGGGLTSKKIKASKAYTAYGQASAGGISVTLGSCYLVATKGKSGGVISGIGTLLKGKNVPIAAKGVVEIYAGKHAKSKC
jgi:hypothetical protein